MFVLHKTIGESGNFRIKVQPDRRMRLEKEFAAEAIHADGTVTPYTFWAPEIRYCVYVGADLETALKRSSPHALYHAGSARSDPVWR